MNFMASTTLFRVGLLSAAVVLALPAQRVSAQEMDHSKMQMPMPMNMPMPPAKPKPAAKPAKKKATKKPKPADGGKHTTHQRVAPKPSTPPVTDHAAMGHDMPMPAASDQAMPPMEGMEMPAADAQVQPMDHSTMQMPMDHSAMPGMSMAPTEPITPIPELTDADRAAAAPPSGGHAAHDNSIQSYTLIDRFETWNDHQGTGVEWEGQAWIGTDLNRVWLRSEGEHVAGHTESADLEVLYGRSVATWWDVVAGVRHDFTPGGSQDFAAIGVMGLAPYKFEVEATAYLGQSGQTAARFEVEYETLLTNRLILQPLLEVNLYGKDDPRRGIGSGLSTVEVGLRLRYEVTRKFAPYIGIVRERAFGGTADLRRADNEDIDDTRFVAGLRIWF
jgi:copper resistance protein B